MNRTLLPRTDWRNATFVGAVWMTALLILTAWFGPGVAAAGWLIGFAFWVQILIGSLTLFMIYRLTGGRWWNVLAPVTEPAAAAVPFLLVAAIPLFAAIPLLYSWNGHPPAIKPDVLSYYLNRPTFIMRTLLAIAGWSALALLLPRFHGRLGQLLAAFGLVFHALVVSSVSIDWYLSLEAPFTSSSFGASVAISSLVAALAFATFFTPTTGDPGIGDVGGLLLATVLGLTYIDFMAVLVIWYGDLPNEEVWFLKREPFVWQILAVAAFLLVSFLPTLALLQARIRNRRRPLRSVAACILVGLFAYDVYLVAPAVSPMAIGTGLIATLGMGLALIGMFLSGVKSLDIFAREPADVR